MPFPQKSSASLLGIGDEAPNFSLPRVSIDDRRGEHGREGQKEDLSSSTVSLSDYRGEKVMLCFNRHPSCPFCAYSIDQLRGSYKKLAWASKLKVIQIFPTPQHSRGWNVWMRSSNSNEKEQSPSSSEESTKGKYPFVVVSDPSEDIYKHYNVQASALGLVAAFSNIHKFSKVGKPRGKSCIQVEMAWLMAPKEGKFSRLPAAFLIDENGRIVDCYRAKRIDQYIPIDRVVCFLMSKPLERLSKTLEDLSRRRRGGNLASMEEMEESMRKLEY